MSEPYWGGEAHESQFERIAALERHLADANRGAETNARVNRIQAEKLIALERELSHLNSNYIAKHDEAKTLMKVCDRLERELADAKAALENQSKDGPRSYTDSR